MESNVEETDAPPRQKASCGCHVGEVTEDLAGTALERHVGQGTEESTENDGDPRKTVLGTLGKDFRCSARKGQAVQSSRGSVQVGGGGGPGGCQKTGVDDRGQGFDARSLDGDDERRSGGVLAAQTEVGIVGRNQEADNECPQNVEQQDSDVDSLDGSRKVASRVLGFTGCNGC